MNMNPNIIQNLREQVNNLTQERYHFRGELRQQVQRNRNLVNVANNLRRRCQLIQNDNDDLNDQNQQLNQEVLNLRNQVQDERPKIFHKRWDQVARQTQRKRKAEYFNVFDRAISKVPECKKAKLTLRICSEDVTLKWSLGDMQNHRDTLRNQGFRFRDPPILQADESESETEQTPQRRKLKRRFVVSLMDEFKLSQRGYHEFRHLISKEAPPIHHIKQERVVMSNQIPYIKHPTVSIIDSYEFC